MVSWEEMRRTAVRDDALRRPPSGVATRIDPVRVRVRAIEGDAIAYTATHVLVEWVWSWAIERRNVELSKCQVLCTDCHKAKTRADRPVPEHGTISRYGSIHKCRCDLCRRANAERKKLNEAKKKALQFQCAQEDLGTFGELIEMPRPIPKAA